MPDIAAQIRAAVASGKLDDATVNHLIAQAEGEVQRLEGERNQSPEKKARIARETAAGQMEAPGFLDNVKAAIWGGKGMEDQNIGHDIARTGRDVASGVTFGLSDRLNPELRAQETAEDPVASGIGKLSGGLLSSAVGPIAAAGKGAAGLLGMAERAVPALGKRALGRVLGQTAVGAGLGAGSGALEAVGAGGDLQDVGDRALSGAALGGLFGGGVTGALEGIPAAARAGFNAIRRTAGGKARELLESRGATVGPLTSGKGGVLDAELAGIKPDYQGMGIAAERGAKAAIPAHRQVFEEDIQQPYRGVKNVIDASPAARQLADASPVYDELSRIADNESLTDAERSVVNKLLDQMEGRYQNPTRIGPRFQMPQKRLNEFRMKLDKLSKAGSQPGTQTPAVAELKGVAKQARDIVDQGPYGELNQYYREGAQQYRNERAMMGLKGKPSSDPQVDVNKLANNLAMRGSNAQSAGRRLEKLDQLMAMRPDLKPHLELPDVLKAKADLQFGLGNADQLSMIDAIKQMGRSKLGRILHANAAPIAGRLLYGPARGLAGAMSRLPSSAPELPGFIPEIEQAYAAALARMQEEQQ